MDDSPRNIAGAKAFGMGTVLVGHSAPIPAADVTIAALEHLTRALVGRIR